VTGADPDTPRRLSRRMLLIHPVQELPRALPALLGAFVAGSGSGRGALWSAGALAITLVFAFSRWFTTRYRVTEDRVEVRTGLLRRRVLAVSRDRVRTVDVTARAMHRLIEVLPHTFRSDWAMVVGHTGDRVVRLTATPSAPSLPSAVVSWFPMQQAKRPKIDPTWEGWGDSEVAAVPAGSSERIVMFGRHGGPEILDSELARLNHLVALAASIETTVDALS